MIKSEFINRKIKEGIVRSFGDEFRQIEELNWAIDFLAKTFYGEKTFSNITNNSYEGLAKNTYVMWNFHVSHFSNVKKEWQCVALFRITLDHHQKLVGNDIVNAYKIVDIDFD